MRKSDKDNSAALFEIRQSPISGVGCFARVPLHRGNLVHRIAGKLVDFEELVKLVAEGSESESDPLQVGIESYIDLDESSRSFNHSCDPNVFVRGMGDLVALRDIAAGEEITYDYSTTMLYDVERIKSHGHEPWTCECRCGARSCRGIINQFTTLPEERKIYYLAGGFAPDYILKIFA